MTDGMLDRPASIRRRPRPSPDEGVDPIDYGTPAAPPPGDENTKAELEPVEHNPDRTPASASNAAAAPLAEATPASAPSSNTVSRKTPTRPRNTPEAEPAHSERPTFTPAPTVATGRPGRPRNREVRMTFSSQLAEDVHDIIDAAVNAEGLTRRAVVELAVRHTWGSLVSDNDENSTG